MTPFEVERRCYHDIIGLYKDVRKMQIREGKQRESVGNVEKGIVRRPAGDDWF